MTDSTPICLLVTLSLIAWVAFFIPVYAEWARAKRRTSRRTK
jgi:hypothetical protein